MSRNLGAPYTDKQPYYFISYNSEDEKAVSQYALELAKFGVPMWYDRGIKAGKEWEIEIAERIENCTAVIMFLSKNIFFKEQSYVHKEFELATEYSKKTVYVIMLDNIQKPEVPVRFRTWWTSVTRLQCINTHDFPSISDAVLRLIEDAGIQPTRTDSAIAAKDNSPERIEYESGDVYEGNTVNGKPSGSGKYIYRRGEILEGTFENGIPVGIGKITFPNGDIFEGSFTNGKRTGRGKLIFANGDVYEGYFMNGRRTGKGKLTYANGNIYEGDFVNNRQTGTGKLTYEDGNIYEGSFVDGVPTGNGKLIFPHGDVCDGEFVNGKPTGNGTITLANGNIYSGTLVDGKPTGKGRYVWTNGDVYEGDFIDSKRTGKGKFIWANGEIYEGDFLNDHRTGKGKYTWPDGETYEGDFVNDFFTGKGIYKWSNGDVYEGDFVKYDRTGKGKLIWANGDVYEGDFVDGIRMGKGKLTNVNGDVYEGDFLDDEITGNGKMTRANGRVIEGTFKNGIQIKQETPPHKNKKTDKAPKPFVFISYTHHNIDIANEIYDILEGCNIDVWMAPQSLTPGGDHMIETATAIKNCSAVVLILSEESQHSIWIQKEIQAALSHNKPIIALKIDNSELASTLQFLLHGSQIISGYDDITDAYLPLVNAVIDTITE